MGLINIFGKSRVQEEKKISTPTSEENQPQKTILRGPGGKFISPKKVTNKKETVKPQPGREKDKKAKPESGLKGPITVTFYGKEVDKYYLNGKLYFSLKSIVGVAAPIDPDTSNGRVSFKKGYNLLKKELVEKVGVVDCVDAAGALKIIHKINGVYPGPFSSWITETSGIPFEE